MFDGDTVVYAKDAIIVAGGVDADKRDVPAASSVVASVAADGTDVDGIGLLVALWSLKMRKALLYCFSTSVQVVLFILGSHWFHQLFPSFYKHLHCYAVMLVQCLHLKFILI